jgi:SAM-dependent methyltransferase
MNEKKKTIQSYNNSVVSYQDNTQAIPPEIDDFIDYLPVKGSVLDIGCGWGRDSGYLADHGFKVQGVDLSPAMIRQARQQFEAVEFLVQDFENLDFPKDSFDAVWAHASLLHCPKKNLNGVLSSIAKILKPKGVFYLSLKEGVGETISLDERYDPPLEKFWSYYQVPELKKVLRKAGFEILVCKQKPLYNAYQSHPFISLICRFVA